MQNKKITISIIIAVLTLIMLVMGATYSYILVETSTTKFSNPKINGVVPNIGTVTIAKTHDLYLNLKKDNILTPNTDTTYYAVAESTNPSSEEISPDIAQITVNGEGTFNCNYTINVTTSGELFNSAVNMGAGLLVLTVDSGVDGSEKTTHDFNNSLNSLQVTGQITGVNSTTPKSIKAQLKYVNSSSIDESVIAGKTGIINFTLETFYCTAVG